MPLSFTSWGLGYDLPDPATTAIRERTTAPAPDCAYITTPVAVNTWSAWTEWIAALPAKSWLASVYHGINAPAASGTYCIEVGIGAAGSEVTIVRMSGAVFCATAVGYAYMVGQTLGTPIALPSATRIAVRVSANVASRQVYHSIQWYQTV